MFKQRKNFQKTETDKEKSTPAPRVRVNHRLERAIMNNHLTYFKKIQMVHINFFEMPKTEPDNCYTGQTKKAARTSMKRSTAT